MVRRNGFTLIEVLIVISIMGILMSLLLPCLLTVRARAGQAVCLSNLRQLGMAVDLYAQDYDELYPYGADPSDQHTSLWHGNPQAAKVAAMPPLNQILQPYIKDARIWHCPADRGYDGIDTAHELPITPTARPTAYDRFGMSYFYHTELGLNPHLYGAITARNLLSTDPAVYNIAVGPAQIFLLADSNGSWHTPYGSQKRYNVLMADGHAVSLNGDEFTQITQLQLQ